MFVQVVIPRTQNTIKYIQAELDELEREDIFRIKKVLEVKGARQLKEEAETAARREQNKKAAAGEGKTGLYAFIRNWRLSVLVSDLLKALFPFVFSYVQRTRTYPTLL